MGVGGMIGRMIGDEVPVMRGCVLAYLGKSCGCIEAVLDDLTAEVVKINVAPRTACATPPSALTLCPYPVAEPP